MSSEGEVGWGGGGGLRNTLGEGGLGCATHFPPEAGNFLHFGLEFTIEILEN